MQLVIPSLHAVYLYTVYLYAVFPYWVRNADHNDLKSYKNTRRNPIGIVNLIKSICLVEAVSCGGSRDGRSLL